MSQKNIQGKFLELYNSLSTNQQRKLREGVNSPYFNKNNNLIRLYVLAEKHSDKDLEQFKLLAYKELFSNTTYDDLVMRHLLSKMLKLAEDILVTLSFNTDDTAKQLGLMQFYYDKQLPNHYAHTNRGYQKMTADNEQYTLDDYRNKYDYISISENYEEQQESRREHTKLQEQSNAIDRYYILAKLKQACASASLQKVFKHRYDIKLLDELLALAKQNYTDDDLIKLYVLGLKTIENNTADADFKALKTMLGGKSKAAKTELKDLHTLAQNFCIRKVNSGVEAYFKELFDLYKISLEQELIQHDAIQFPPAFKNMVSVALRLKEFNWAERFIKHYTQFIDEAYREDYLNYNLARVYFEQSNYDEALTHINQMPFNDLFITLNARMLQIKAFVEQDEYELAESYMDSFKQYLHRRKKSLGYHQSNFLNNIRYTKRILYFNGNKLLRDRLLNKIKTETLLTEKRWLLDNLA